MGDTEKIKTIRYRYDMDKYSVYRYRDDTILACFQDYLYMLLKAISSLEILISVNTLRSNIAKESGIAILQLICMEGVVVGVANIISI